MGSWDGEPYAVKIIPEIYLELLKPKVFEDGKVENLVMGPGVSATTVVKAFMYPMEWKLKMMHSTR